MEWTMYDKSMVLLATTCGWFIATGIWWFLTRKSRIYWNNSEKQIKNMSGECLYDKAAFEVMRHGLYGDTGSVTAMIKRMDTIEAQLQCSAKGHGDWGFVESLKSHPKLVLPVLVFKCSICNLEINKTEEELSETKREALVELDVIKEKE